MTELNAPNAPQAIGPYSHATKLNGLIFCSGQIPLDPDSMEIVEGGIKEQTKQVFANLEAVLAEAGSNLSQVMKTTIFLTDMDDFSDVNRVYAKSFGKHKPARSTVAVSALPLGAKVEIECVAVENQQSPPRPVYDSGEVHQPSEHAPSEGELVRRRKKRRRASSAPGSPDPDPSADSSVKLNIIPRIGKRDQ